MDQNVATEDHDKDFTAGFLPDAPPAKATVAAKPEAEVPAVEPVPEAAQAEPLPKYVQITEDDLNGFRAAAAKTAAIEGQLSKVFGTVGNLKQVVDTLRSATPAGANIELTDDDFAELAADFPELAKHTRASFEKVLKKANLRGTADAPAKPDPDEVQKLFNQAADKREETALAEAHPNWRDIVGAQSDTANPFRKWLSTQTPAYQKRINETYSATTIEQAIDRFHAAAKAAAPAPKPNPAPKDAARRDRIAGALQPRGDGGPPASGKPASDPFLEGFAGR